MGDDLDHPIEADQPLISELAQKIVDLCQGYGRERGLTYPGVMSALATAGGVLIGSAYTDAGTRRGVCQQLPKAMLAWADMTASYKISVIEAPVDKDAQS